ARARLEWISRGRECRQLVAWFGDLAGRAGECQATVLGSGKPPRTVRGPRLPDPPIAEQVGRYICEPDAAVLAAKLAGTLAREHGLLRIAPRVAYLTSDRPTDDPALACFEIRELLPARAKKLKALLRERNVGRLEIKKRGIEVDPAALIKQLDLRGEQEATLILTRIAGQGTAILARRVT
ncbi:MAG TPA: hypothetical protein VHV08_17085, partial [Pirellulales bacterium]|nr:hypothetical protein [Pirellulales bacterium]